jgi:hypothetical protein
MTLEQWHAKHEQILRDLKAMRAKARKATGSKQAALNTEIRWTETELEVHRNMYAATAPRERGELAISRYEFTRALRFVAHCMAQPGGSRGYLQGVALTISGSWARLEATDGHRCARVFLPAADYGTHRGTWIMRREDVVGLLKAWKPRADELSAITLWPMDPGVLSIWSETELRQLPLHTGTWPDFDRVIPTGEVGMPADEVGVDPRYLAQAAQALHQYAPGGARLAVYPGPSAPIQLRSGEASVWISPIRL